MPDLDSCYSATDRSGGKLLKSTARTSESTTWFSADTKSQPGSQRASEKWVKMAWKMGGNRAATLALLFASSLLLLSAANAADLDTESDDFEDGYVEDVQVSSWSDDAVRKIKKTREKSTRQWKLLEEKAKRYCCEGRGRWLWGRGVLVRPASSLYDPQLACECVSLFQQQIRMRGKIKLFTNRRGQADSNSPWQHQECANLLLHRLHQRFIEQSFYLTCLFL